MGDRWIDGTGPLTLALSPWRGEKTGSGNINAQLVDLNTQSECLERFVVCPLCEARLVQAGNTVCCANRHAFDVAREGYVNFGSALGRAPRISGDTREMLAARRRFLGRGFYQPLSDAIGDLVSEFLTSSSGDVTAPVGVLDAGCGEGY